MLTEAQYKSSCAVFGKTFCDELLQKEKNYGEDWLTHSLELYQPKQIEGQLSDFFFSDKKEVSSSKVAPLFFNNDYGIATKQNSPNIISKVFSDFAKPASKSTNNKSIVNAIFGS